MARFYMIMMLLLVVSMISCLRSAPLPEQIDEYISEDGSLPTPPSLNEQFHMNNFMSNLLRCLKLRDDKFDLVSLGCVPDVFPAIEDIPKPISNTVLSFTAMNTSLTVDGREMKSTLDITEQTDFVKIHSIHLHFHKKSINDETFNDTICNVRKGINISVLLATQTVTIVNFTFAITSNELSRDMWFDVHLDQYITDIYPEARNKLNLSISIAGNDCSDAVSLEDLGIEIENKNEPVLIMFANEHVQLVIQRLLNQSLKEEPSQLHKRQIEGSGSYVSDPMQCRLKKSYMPYAQLSRDTTIDGHFEFNYCAGHCIYPLSHNNGVAFYHSIFLAVFQLDKFRSSVETAATPPPCCVPVEYSAIYLPIRDTAWNLKTILVEDIVATKCACR